MRPDPFPCGPATHCRALRQVKLAWQLADVTALVFLCVSMVLGSAATTESRRLQAFSAAATHPQLAELPRSTWHAHAHAITSTTILEGREDMRTSTCKTGLLIYGDHRHRHVHPSLQKLVAHPACVHVKHASRTPHRKKIALHRSDQFVVLPIRANSIHSMHALIPSSLPQSHLMLARPSAQARETRRGGNSSIHRPSSQSVLHAMPCR